MADCFIFERAFSYIELTLNSDARYDVAQYYRRLRPVVEQQVKHTQIWQKAKAVSSHLPVAHLSGRWGR